MNASILRSLALTLWLGPVMVLGSDPSVNDAPGEDRVTRATGGFAAEREAGGPRDRAALEELKLAPHEVVTQAKPQGVLKSIYYGDAWIYDASVELFDDFDRDGYYSYLRVWFDVDSLFDRHWVYAVLLLSADGVTWEDLYITDDFLVRGTSPYDAYEIDIELVSGYPTGLYDVLIEIYDADRGLLLDELGPAHSSALALLPLEDVRHDSVVPPVSKSRGGGGSASWLLLALLGGAALVKRGCARSIIRPGRPALPPWRTTSARALAGRIWP
jgi:hypothetical protein